ncbi:MAG: sodium/glutamate symporter [Verrucomicrobiales bacterium]|nr:sodium/glutamate symporter [Verrucomicrobiales bacterium]
MIHLDDRETLILAILTLFLGKLLNSRVKFFRTWNLPEPVVGGVLVSLIFALIYFVSGKETQFDLSARDSLLLVFFTTIGLNARFATLVKGGKPLLILLVVAVAYLVVQNITGVIVAKISGLPGAVGVLGGSVSLSGGHGTAIAWTPAFQSQYGINAAGEIGIACATFGLILGGVIGGPIGNFLITRNKLKSEHLDQDHLVGIPSKSTSEESTLENRDYDRITVDGFLSSLLVISIAFGIGTEIDGLLRRFTSLELPNFVTCLFAGILLTNLVGVRMKRVKWPAETASLAFISELSLGLFLALSLMSLQLQSLLELAGPIVILLAAQVVVMALWAIFVVFRVMGRNYAAAVMAAGYCGLGLGATPTAIANMSAITKKCGPSPQAFLLLPLVGAFFIDIANAFVIQFFLDKVS